MFIRFFADTTGSQLSYYALEYMRSFMRVAPVRLVSVTGILAGRWQAYAQLLTTPMVGQLHNAVCCDPSRWTWIEKVPVAARPVDHQQIVAGGELAVPEATEVLSGRQELYTTGVRNVLFAVAPPRDTGHLSTAIKYEAIVVPTDAHASGWRKNGIDRIVVIGGWPKGDPSRDTMADYHHAIRDLFIPRNPS